MKKSYIKITETIKIVDNILSIEECGQIKDYCLSKVNKEVDAEKMPWQNKNNFALNKIDNDQIKEIIRKCRQEVLEIVQQDVDDTVFPNHSDLVYWSAGQKMGRHSDNDSYNPKPSVLKAREFSAIVYINDDYEGGETFIGNSTEKRLWWWPLEDKFSPIESDILINPNYARCAIFASDDRNAHGVTEVLSGERITLAFWFTTNPKYVEKD